MAKRRNPMPAAGPNRSGDVSTRLFGGTDYDIPRFGFASALVITVSFVAAYLVVPSIIPPAGLVGTIGSSLAGGVLVGGAFAGTRFVAKKGKGRWQLSILEFIAVSCLSSAFLFIMNAQGV